LEKENDIFLSVLERNKGIIYKVANSYISNEEDRKDLVQEIIFQLWKSFHRYDDQFRLSTWIYKIALNVSISYYRKESRKREYHQQLTEFIIDTVPDEKPSDQNRGIILLKQFISEMKELDRALVILYLDEKSHREMAEILGLSETNIATKISRIKEKLKQRFAGVDVYEDKQLRV
jgi:RNA polymerase sigma factor (sigma-70 family)